MVGTFAVSAVLMSPEIINRAAQGCLKSVTRPNTFRARDRFEVGRDASAVHLSLPL
jgi:hypothetical protein